MRIDISKLRRTEGGTEQFHFHEEFPPIQVRNDTFVFKSPLDVDLQVSNTGKSFLVRGNLKAEIGAFCSRCLKEFPYYLSLSFDDEWVIEENVSEELRETAFVISNEEFEVDDRLVEHILLHLPMKFICSEDCKGLCPRCGQDRNVADCGCEDEVIDPRLAVLSEWNKGV